MFKNINIHITGIEIVLISKKIGKLSWNYWGIKGVEYFKIRTVTGTYGTNPII